MQERIINGDLRIEGYEYVCKGDLIVEGSIAVINGSLIVEGDLLLRSKCSSINITVYSGIIYAKSITTLADICITYGNLSTFKDLRCKDILCYGGNISVGGNTHVQSVRCRNYLVTGINNSDDIIAEQNVYIMDFSTSKSITAPEVFLVGGGNFQGGTITADCFEAGWHIYNCLRRFYIHEPDKNKTTRVAEDSDPI